MKFLLSVLGLYFVCGTSIAVAAEAWTEVTRNAVGDRFFVNQNELRQEGNTVWYWEYRYFQQPNDAFVTFEVEQPVYGVMLYQSVDCATGVARLRQLRVFDQNQQQFTNMNYGDTGELAQPVSGSSAAKVIQFVCNPPSSTSTPATPTP